MYDGQSIYHGMNLRVQKKYSHGLDFIAAYTGLRKSPTPVSPIWPASWSIPWLTRVMVISADELEPWDWEMAATIRIRIIETSAPLPSMISLTCSISRRLMNSPWGKGSL